MKKLLLSLAVVLGLMPTIGANAEVATLTQKWTYSSEQLGAGWDAAAPNWSSTDAIKSKSCARFATAADGKIYILNMKTMSIAQVTADGIKDLYKLPSLEGVTVDVNGTATPDYYGTSISIDQAGNFIVGHMFTKAQSVLRYTVYSPKTNKAKHFDLTVPEGMMVMRNDCMGRVLGDMTKDAYAYIAPGDFVQAGGVVTPGTNAGGTYATNQKVRVLHFTGDGDVDNIAMTDQWSGMIYLGSHLAYNNICQPIYASMEDAKDVAATSTFMSASAYQPAMVDNQPQKPTATYFGFTATGAENWGYSGFGSTINAATNGFDTFVVDGKRYYVRNNMAEIDLWNPNTMDVAVYDAEFNIVAQWTNPEYKSKFGYSSIVAEPVEGGANIYVYNSTVQYGESKIDWGAAAMLFFAPGNGEVAPDGSAEHPYVISTPEDLCDMHNKIVADKKVYFVLENDIDMAGVTDYVPAIGSDGATYVGEFEFDGQNHVISNFAPEAKYSYMSLFGVIRGNVKNLGVENAEIVSNSLGAGVLGGYGSQGGVNCEITNVWATGSVTGNGVYAGGLVGTNGNNLTIKNCYFNGDVFGKFAGGLVGRARAGVTISNSYAAGEVSATENAAGIAGTDKDATVSIALNDVIAWNTSVSAPENKAFAVTALGYTPANVQVWEGMTINGTAVTDGVAAATLATTATAWEGWKTTLHNGYPALAWQVFPGTEDNPYVISSAEELIAFGELVKNFTADSETYVVLGADFDLADSGFKTISVKDKGVYHLDGQNHIISHVTGIGLFDRYTGTIKNLGVVDGNVDGGQWGCAGLIIAYAGTETVIENCFATGKAVGYYPGGIAAGVDDNCSLTVRNCYVNAEVYSGNSQAGGIVAAANYNANLTIENCYAAGSVKAAGQGNSAAGGITSGMKIYLATADLAANITIKNCVSYNQVVEHATNAGAICPEQQFAKMEVADCLVGDGTTVNGAAVEGAVSTYELQKTITGWEAYNNNLADGMPVLAWQEASESLPIVVASVDDLFDLIDVFEELTDNSVTTILIDADLDLTDELFMPLECKGTIHLDGQNHVIKNVTINSETAAPFKDFKGTIKNLGMENVDMKAGVWGPAAAIASYGIGETLIENCYATGKVTGFYAGGILGGVKANADVMVRNCYSSVEVVSPNGWAGGIVGPTNETGKLLVENCYASGTVNAANGGAGIAAGFNANYTNPCDVELKNVVAWNPSVVGPGSETFARNHETLINLTITDAVAWDGMTINGVAVEGGKTTAELQALVTGWEAFNDKLNDGMPVLAWQEANGEESGVEAIDAADNVAPVYYNLQGVRVQNPANGVYIVKRGNKVSKVFIR